MNKARFSYVLATMTFLGLVSWMSIRAYDSMIGQIYYSPLKGFFKNALRLGPQDPANSFKTRVAVYRSHATANSFGDPKKYDSLLLNWIRILNHQRIPSDIIESKDLFKDEILDSYNVLLMPLATYLSDEEMSAIKKFASKRGHGLIFTGAAGAYHEDGEWRDISLAAEILGGEDIQEVPPKEKGTAYMILDGRNPLSANIPPGLRMGINVYDRPVSVRLLEPRTETAGYWEEPAVKPSETSKVRAGIAIGDYGRGRFVWMGFTIGSVIDPFGLKAGEILARNMLAYASFVPIFAKQFWPGGKQAAVVFAQEADEKLADSKEGVELFLKKRIPCTFFCPVNGAAKNHEAFKSIYSNPGFEVGLAGARRYEGQSLEEQREMLQNGKNLLENLSRRPVRGFSPFEAAYDKNTIQALLDTEYSYLAGGPLHGGPPEVLEARKPLLRVGRQLKLLMGFPHTQSTDGLSLENLKKNFDTVYQFGGFYTLSIPSRILKDKKNAEVLSQFVDYVKTKEVWFANFSQAADWSSRWMMIDVESAKTSEARSNLLVTNGSPGDIDRLRLNMYFPSDNSSISTSAEKMGGIINVISQQRGRAVLEIQDLRGDGLVFFVDKNTAL